LTKDISIVIVTWNSEEEISECLRGIFTNPANDYFDHIEAIIIDNASQDNTINTIESYKKLIDHDIRLIANKENLGFTRGANIGLHQARYETVMILNPDTEIYKDALVLLHKKLYSDDSIAIVAPQLVYRSKEIQHSCRTLPTYRDMFFEIFLLSRIFSRSNFFARYKMNNFAHDTEREVEQPMGAALMIKQSVLKEVDYFDDMYDMFFNDVDLCKKVKLAGYKIIFYPTAQIVHRKGISVYKNRAYMISLWNKDCLRYFKKFHYNIILYPLLSFFLHLSGAVRKLFSR
jgi:GT2 family glycosyltransferase